MKKTLYGLVLFVFIACTAHASPVTIDFETVPFGAGFSGDTVTIDGVDFDGWIMGFGIAGGAGFSQPSITFTNGPVTLFGFDYLTGLGTTCLLNGNPFNLDFGLHSFANPAPLLAVQSISFGFSSNMGGILMDNLTFEPSLTETPIPGPLALLGLALAGFLGIRKKMQA
jgi:hypothetical protein